MLPRAMRATRLERHQVWLYLAAAVLGLVGGTLWPRIGGVFDVVVWPLLVALLYATFTQVPLRSIVPALGDVRFLGAVLVGNFLLMPALVWLLILFTPADDALRVGLLLVLLVPCTDWFITFTHLAGGDTARAITLTPVNLLLQLLLLPVYVWLMAPAGLGAAIGLANIWPAVLVVLVPLAAAAISEPLLDRRADGHRLRRSLGHAPVPLLALVILAVTTAHAEVAAEARHLVPVVVAVAVAYLVGALVVGKVSTVVVRLSPAAGRTLTLSMATRNSFVVLPVALTLPAGWEVAALVIVVQSLVELFAMIACLWFVPRVLIRDH